MTNNSLTAVILTKNESGKLSNCLKNLSWVNQILIIDDYSTDETVSIVKEFGAEVIKRKLDNFASQRNFALGKVKTEWVLMIDADEELPDDLKNEMIGAIKSDRFDGYSFPRKNYIFGKWIQHSGWYPDYQLHLFKAGKAKYVGLVHEQVEIKGKVGRLDSPLIHQNYQSISQYLTKMESYTSLAAEILIVSKEGFKVDDLFRKPPSEFLRRFFAEKGYKDGLHGFVLAVLQAFSELVVYLKVWEAQKYEPKDLPFNDFVVQIKKLGGELAYWMDHTLVEEAKTPLSKLRSKVNSFLNRQK